MVEYGILAVKKFTFSLSGGSSELIVYFLMGGIVFVVIGYWIKKMTGAITAFLYFLVLNFYRKCDMSNKTTGTVKWFNAEKGKELTLKPLSLPFYIKQFLSCFFSSCIFILEIPHSGINKCQFYAQNHQ